MGQDRNSGYLGYKFGYEMAAKVADFLGTELVSNDCNEIILKGELFVIKSAHKDTPEIGVTANTLEEFRE